jgi:DNA modification methylase
MIADDLKPLATPLKDLKPLPGNPRKGDVEAVRRSYERFGQRKPIVAQRDGTVIAGNHQLKAAQALGWSEMAVVWVDDDEQTAKAFALADNRTADLGSYDNDALAELLADVATDPELLLATGYSQQDLDDLLGSVDGGDEIEEPDAVPDSAPSKTVKGDVWLLGPHRLMCGDSTVPTDVERLMAGAKADMVWTDPPYGMNLDTNYSTMHKRDIERGVRGGVDYRPVIGDSVAFDPTLIMGMFADVDEQFWWGADYYRAHLPQGGSWVVWDKRHNDQGMNLDAVLGAAFELCFSKQQHKREIARVLWTGHHGMQREDTKKRVHPTQKPVALVQWFFERWGKVGDRVIDLFGGSGVTLIAAHAAGRIAYLMELDEHYCDIICARFQKATGITPVNEATKREHSFID